MLTWKAHDAAVYDLAFTPDGRQLVTSGGDETVRLWDASDQSKVREWPGSKVWCPLAVSPDGEFVARGGYGVKCWPIAKSASVIRHTGYAESIAFSPDGCVLTVGASNGLPLRRWSVQSGKPLSGGWGEPRTGHSAPVGAIAYSSDARTLATAHRSTRHDRMLKATTEYVIVFRNSKTGEASGQLCPKVPAPTHATRLAFSPNGKLLSGIYGPVLIVWDVKTKRAVARHQPAKKHFKGVAFTQDGKRLLTASNEQVVQVWAAPTWGETTAYAWKIGKLGCVAVSADGTLAAAGGSTGKVVVWDLD